MLAFYFTSQVSTCSRSWLCSNRKQPVAGEGGPHRHGDKVAAVTRCGSDLTNYIEEGIAKLYIVALEMDRLNPPTDGGLSHQFRPTEGNGYLPPPRPRDL